MCYIVDQYLHLQIALFSLSFKIVVLRIIVLNNVFINNLTTFVCNFFLLKVLLADRKAVLQNVLLLIMQIYLLVRAFSFNFPSHNSKIFLVKSLKYQTVFQI